MAGASPREKAAQGLFNEVGNINPTVTNRFDSFKYPYNSKDQINTLNEFTNLGSNIIKQNTATNANTEGSAAARRFTAQGYGGSLLEDAVSGAREAAGASGTSALQQLQAKRLELLPGIMTTANKEAFQQTEAGQNVDFQNLQNLFRKFTTQYGMLDAFSGTNTFDDILATLNTLGSLAQGAGKAASGFGGGAAAGAAAGG